MRRFDFDLPSSAATVESSTNYDAMPYGAWRAAHVLLKTPHAERVHAGLDTLLAVVNTDGCVVDPPVTAYLTIDTGTCRIYMRETVRLSEYLLACIWKLQLPLQLTRQSATVAIEMDELKVKPWSGKQTVSEKVQALGLAEAVKMRVAELENGEALLARVARYFATVGPLNSLDACIYDILQLHQERVAEALASNEPQEGAKRARFE